MTPPFPQTLAWVRDDYLHRRTLAAVALHEAGHACAAEHLGLPWSEVTIAGRNGLAGWTRMADAPMREHAVMLMLLCGGAAERHLNGTAWSDLLTGSCREDFQPALRDLGMERFAAALTEASALVQRLAPQVDAIAVALLQERFLTRGQVIDILRTVSPQTRR